MTILNNYENIQNLKPIKILGDEKSSRLCILKNKDTNKLAIYNISKNQFLLENCTELSVYEEEYDQNTLACVNIDGKCGIFDITNQEYIFPLIYDKARIIPSKECLPNDSTFTCMCVLELYSNSSLYSVSKNKNNKYLINQMIPNDNYDNIQTQLFESSHVSFSSGKKVEYSDKILYVELTKYKQKGCIIFEKENNNKIKMISNIPICFEDIRPSLFDGDDNLDLSEDEIYEDNDCYLYESTPYIVGNNGNKLIRRKLILNEDKCVTQIKKGFLIYKENKAWGVIYKDKKIIDSKFSPLFLIEPDENDFSKTSITATTRTGQVYEYISDLNNWKNNLIIKAYNENQEQKLFEDFMKNLLSKQDERQ